MKYTKDKICKLLALRGLELLEWDGNLSAGITYKKLKDSSIHHNTYPNEMLDTIRYKFPEEYNTIVYGTPHVTITSGNKGRYLKNFEVIEYNSCDNKKDSIKSKFICKSCNTPFEHFYNKISQSGKGCPQCGCFEDMVRMPCEILKECKLIVDPDIVPNVYWISKKGIIYSTIGRFKEIKQATQDGGHKVVAIGKGSHDTKEERALWTAKKLVHRLVLIAFGFPQPSPQHIVRHKNDIPDDNHLDNLKWGLSVDNSKDMEDNYIKRQVAVKHLHSLGASVSDLSVACKLSECVIQNMLI